MRSIVTIIILLTTSASYAQDYRISIIENIRTRGNKDQGIFPILAYDNGLLIGGFGIGISRLKEINSKYDLKLSANLTRQVYWSEQLQYTKGPNQNDLLGRDNPVTGELYTSFLAIGHRKLRKKFSLGAGLGFEVLIISVKSIKPSAFTTTSGHTSRNREFKPVMPVVPLEISWKEEKILYTIHGEIGLLNRYRRDLPNYGRNIYGLIAFEIGLKI